MTTTPITNTSTIIKLINKPFEITIEFNNLIFKTENYFIKGEATNDKIPIIPTGLYYKKDEYSELKSNKNDFFGNMIYTHKFELEKRIKTNNCNIKRFEISNQDLKEALVTKYLFTGILTNKEQFKIQRNLSEIIPTHEKSIIHIKKYFEKNIGIPAGTYQHQRDIDMLIEKENFEFSFIKIKKFNLIKKQN
jgi:hypothetical protein